MRSFWNDLPTPFFTLAPMADVTDPAYRKLIATYGKPSVMWTEFVSADGLYHTREKKGMLDAENPLVRDLQYGEGERPIVAQLFSGSPEMMEYAARYAFELGFDGVDINMGCPDRSIEKQGAGAASIRNPERSCEVILAAIRGTQGKIPVSVKTRLGYNRMEYTEWLPKLLDTGISALTLHLRTRKEMSKVDAHWELAPELVSLCKSIRPDIVLSGNGDVKDLEDAKQKAEASGFDGIMLGRAIFGNPWVFAGRKPQDLTPEERIAALRILAKSFDELTPQKHFALLKKHFKAFVSGWDGAADLRARIMETNSFEELEEMLRTI